MVRDTGAQQGDVTPPNPWSARLPPRQSSRPPGRSLSSRSNSLSHFPPALRSRVVLSGLASVILAGVLCATAAAADGQGPKGPSEAVFVAEVVALLLVGRLMGEGMLRLGQPAVVGQLLAGILLGPSVLGWLAPHWHQALFPADPAQKAMIDGVAKLGVLLLLLLTGMETDVALVRSVGRPAASVSITGIAVPFGCGLLAGLWLLPDSLLPAPDKRLVTAMFLGTALSISSIKIVAMVIEEMAFMRRNLGQIIVASAIIDDTIGWLIVAVTIGLAKPEGLSVTALAGTVGGIAVFLVVSATIGRRLVAALMRWSNDRLVSELPAVTAILVVMGLMALTTDALGVNTVLGAFVAGVLVGQSKILTKRVEAELRGLVIALFAPIFFGIAGLGTDLTILKDPKLLGLTIGLVLIASLGKFAGAFAGGRFGGLTRAECLALALGMNARGSTEVIVASIGLAIGALNETLFTMIVTMAVITTMAMPPSLRWALARLPVGKAEAERLEREAFEDTGFVANIERLLVARDGGSSGRLAARLAGLIGGAADLPVTVMPIGGWTSAEAPAALAEVEAGVMVSRRQSTSVETVDAVVDATLRPIGEVGDAAAVGQEARKGYSLVVIGREPAAAPDGGLHPDLASVLGSFGGARAVVVARGALRDEPLDGPLQVLIPISGTDASRRAAEIGFALCRSQGARATLLVIADPPRPQDERDGRRRRRAAPVESDVLGAMTAIAARFGLAPTTVTRVAEDKLSVVMGQARRAEDTLIVLGVVPRASDSRPFGALAHGLLEGSSQSLLLVVHDSVTGVATRPAPVETKASDN